MLIWAAFPYKTLCNNNWFEQMISLYWKPCEKNYIYVYIHLYKHVWFQGIVEIPCVFFLFQVKCSWWIQNVEIKVRQKRRERIGDKYDPALTTPKISPNQKKQFS